MFLYKELSHSAAGLTVSVGRNDYKGYKLFCNAFFHGCPRDCRVKPDNDNYLFVIPRFPSFPRHIQAFLPFVIPVLDTGIQKIQGTSLRYARRKQRASTKICAAAIDAVKLATACAQGRLHVSRRGRRSECQRI